MLLVSNLVLDLDSSSEDIAAKIAKVLNVPKSRIKSFEYYRKSIDARNKESITIVGSFLVSLDSEKGVRLGRKAQKVDESKLHPLISRENLALDHQPAVVGLGPCGLFIALYLARKGLRPLVFEQGKDVDSRNKDVEEFLKSGKLNVSSNIQFGEGGAGTYSDGKLTTSSNGELVKLVIEELIKAGAPKEIGYLNKPHIGTDLLREVVKNIRQEICSLGGEVYFEHQFVDLIIKDDEVQGLIVENHGKKKEFKTKAVFLAIGHSARATFEMLYSKNIAMEKKAFAMGVRVEHYQETINKMQYGRYADNKNLPPADYKIVKHLDNGRTVYTFCMCPGGEVICASSEEGGLVVNGMSLHGRSSNFANSALLVNVNPNDIEGESPLSGIYFQRKYEQLAYHHLYKAIGQNMADFLENKASKELNRLSSYRLGLIPGDVSTYFPTFISESLRLGLKEIGKQLPSFIGEDGLLIGLESRSSSPLRIVRNSDYESLSLRGLYPCGEGAGYAGGIVTSAVDGIRAAQSFCKKIVAVLE